MTAAGPLAGHGRDIPRNYTAVNARIIWSAAQLYIPLDAIVADVTYGKGNFWTGIQPYEWFTLIPSDIDPQRSPWGTVIAADFRQLPYRDASITGCLNPLLRGGLAMSVDHMPRDVTGDRHLLNCASNSAEAAELRRDYSAVLRSLGLVPLFTIEVQAPRKGRRGYLVSVFRESGEREP